MLTPSDSETVRQRFQDYWPFAKPAQVEAVLDGLRRFRLPEILDALKEAYKNQERNQLPGFRALAELLGAETRIAPQRACAFCDGSKSFPIEFEVLTQEHAQAMQLESQDRHVLAFLSTRTDIPENQRLREYVAIPFDLWGRWPKITKRLVIQHACHHCAPRGADLFLTIALVDSRFGRLDPKHGHLKGDLERVLGSRMAHRGPPLPAEKVAQDDALWDALLDQAANDGDQKRHAWLLGCRERLRKGGPIMERSFARAPEDLLPIKEPEWPTPPEPSPIRADLQAHREKAYRLDRDFMRHLELKPNKTAQDKRQLAHWRRQQIAEAYVRQEATRSPPSPPSPPRDSQPHDSPPGPTSSTEDPSQSPDDPRNW